MTFARFAGWTGVVAFAMGVGYFAVRPACGCIEGADVETASIALQTLGPVVTEWSHAHPGACPTFERLVADQVLASSSSDGDPWGTPYVFECGGQPRVVSAGPDRIAGTRDDVALGRVVP